MRMKTREYSKDDVINLSKYMREHTQLSQDETAMVVKQILEDTLGMVMNDEIKGALKEKAKVDFNLDLEDEDLEDEPLEDDEEETEIVLSAGEIRKLKHLLDFLTE